MPTILIVEDDEDGRKMVSLVLEGEGYCVVGVRNGDEALACLRKDLTKREHVLILLDLRMPRMDGWAFRREQKRDPALCRVPFMIMSATLPDPGDPLCREAVALFGKPLNVEALLTALARHFGPAARPPASMPWRIPGSRAAQQFATT